ncbi:MAG: NgoFVII family restriction endonuclease, partial [Acinetobacter sp.]
MLFKNLAQKLLFSPISEGADTLLVLSGYATPNMASWLITSLQDRQLGPINISLLVGMIPYDGLSVSVHEGFKALHGKSYGTAVQNFTCSYVYENP